MSSYTKQLFNKDDKYFRKYIENTTAHGVIRIFSGKSVIRRLFWLVIVLGATTGCLYNISNRISYLAGGPTATTLSLERQDNLTFPAVTICNLNQFRQEVIDAIHPELGTQLRQVYYTDSLSASEIASCNDQISDFVENATLEHITFENLTFDARDPISELIGACFFSGKRCTAENFSPFLTNSGYCYTFNTQVPLQKAVSTGVRAGLHLVLNINQSQYVSSSSFDAGVKVVVHTQSEPPRPEDTGVGVPPGTNAFIGVRQRNVIDNTLKECETDINTYDFNFLSKRYHYSIASCNYDCQLTRVAEKCNCTIGFSYKDKFTRLRKCTLSDMCCIVEQQRLTIDCNCPAACKTTDYEIINSCSAYPAMYATQDIADLFNFSFTSTHFLSVNVYFETLNIETQTTNYAYGFVALLSDIGGQLGLFLGLSVISIMEFGTWIIDEVKNRLFGDKLSEKKLCCCCKQNTEEDETELKYAVFEKQ